MVSVCMATYNGEKYLKEQISSILPQLTEEDELIISDDGSTDNTRNIVYSFNDPRIFWYDNLNHGVNNNFENAISHSKGDYIFLADQDDIWQPHKVEILLTAMNDSLLVVHDCIVVDTDLKEIESSYFEKHNSGPGFLKNIIQNTYIGACMAFRRELLEVAMPISKRFPVYHDGWFASLAELCGMVKFLEFKGILYRRHSNNTSVSAGKSNIKLHKQVKNRMLWICCVLKRYIVYKLNLK